MNDTRVNFVNVDIARLIREAEAELIGEIDAPPCTACKSCRATKDAGRHGKRCSNKRGEGLLHAATTFDPATLSRES